MPQPTPKRAGRKPKAGSRFPAQVLADNVRAYRQVRGLSQEQLGEKMAELGHPWTAGIVGFVERGDRNVTVDELLGLALALGFHPGKLLDPSGVLGIYGAAEPASPTGLDVGIAEPLTFGEASAWLAGDQVVTVTPGPTVEFRPVPPTIDEDNRQIRIRERLAENFNAARAKRAEAKEENT